MVSVPGWSGPRTLLLVVQQCLVGRGGVGHATGFAEALCQVGACGECVGVVRSEDSLQVAEQCLVGRGGLGHLTGFAEALRQVVACVECVEVVGSEDALLVGQQLLVGRGGLGHTTCSTEPVRQVVPCGECVAVVGSEDPFLVAQQSHVGRGGLGHATRPPEATGQVAPCGECVGVVGSEDLLQVAQQCLVGRDCLLEFADVSKRASAQEDDARLGAERLFLRVKIKVGESLEEPDSFGKFSRAICHLHKQGFDGFCSNVVAGYEVLSVECEDGAGAVSCGGLLAGSTQQRGCEHVENVFTGLIEFIFEACMTVVLGDFFLHRLGKGAEGLVNDANPGIGMGSLVEGRDDVVPVGPVKAVDDIAQERVRPAIFAERFSGVDVCRGDDMGNRERETHGLR